MSQTFLSRSSKPAPQAEPPNSLPYKPVALQKPSSEPVFLRSSNQQQVSSEPPQPTSVPTSFQSPYPVVPQQQNPSAGYLYQPSLPYQHTSAPSTYRPTYQPAIAPQGSSSFDQDQTPYNQSYQRPNVPYPLYPQDQGSTSFQTPLPQQRLSGSYQQTSSFQQDPYDPYSSSVTGYGATAPNYLPGVFKPTQSTSQPQTFQPSSIYQGADDPSAPDWQRTSLDLSTQTAQNAEPLATVIAYDGEDPRSFTAAQALSTYIKLFPEAENDQGCRAFIYGPKCPSNLLLPLFEHLDYPRFSLFPYGFANDFSSDFAPEAGVCRCTRCSDAQPCGHYVLYHHFNFLRLQDSSSLPTSSTPRIATVSSALDVSARTRYLSTRIW